MRQVIGIVHKANQLMWTDPYVTGWQTELNTKGIGQAGQHAVLMLDSAFMPGVYQRLANGSDGDANRCQALFDALPGSSDDARALSPVLVEYKSDNSALCKILDQLDGKPMLSLIQTRETVTQLAERLEQWCVIETSDSFFNFRFADTRRLPAIARILSAQQIAHMLGPASSWECINRYGKWERLPLNATAQPCEKPGKLTDEQFSALVSDSEADEILAVLEPDFPHAVRERLPSWRYDCAREALRKSDMAGEHDTSIRITRVKESLAERAEPVDIGERS